MTNSKHFPVIILGGGIAGLSAAYHLPDQHILFEKSSVAGGLASSIKKDGFTFDHTGHLLHLRDESATDLVFKLLGKNIQKHDRNAWIYSYNTFTKYPFQANTYGLPKDVVRECVNGFAELMKSPKRRPDEVKSFHAWALDTFGKGFVKHFFYPYNKKLWTVSPEVLTAEWVGKFVPRPSLEDVVAGSLTDQNLKIGYNSSFYYPKVGGIQALVDGFLSKGNINIQLNSPVCKIDLKHKAVWVLGESVPYYYDYLVNTLPLPLLVQLVENIPVDCKQLSSRLRWTSVLNINFGVTTPHVGGDKHWIYFPEAKYPFYRIGFPKNFANTVAPAGCSSVYVEVAYPGGHLPQGKEEGEVIFRCIDSLRDIGIFKPTDEIKTILPIRIPIAYVIYDRERTPTTAHLLEYFRLRKVYCAGRYGRWQYSYMEEAIIEGETVANRVLSGLSSMTRR